MFPVFLFLSCFRVWNRLQRHIVKYLLDDMTIWKSRRRVLTVTCYTLNAVGLLKMNRTILKSYPSDLSTSCNSFARSVQTKRSGLAKHCNRPWIISKQVTKHGL